MSSNLAYHEITAEAALYRYAVSASAFRSHLQLIAQVEPSGRPVLTFDDGHASHFQSALPLLEEAGLHAIFFVLPGRLQVQKQYMTWSQVRELSQLGHTIGSHGLTHTALTRCKLADRVNELTTSRQMIEDHLGRSVSTISMPFGRYDDEVVRACSETGYSEVYTSDVHLVSCQAGSVRLHGRLMVQNHHDLQDVQSLISRSGWCFRTLQLQEWLKAPVRRVLGESCYHNLWCKLAGEKASKQIHQQYGAAVVERSQL